MESLKVNVRLEEDEIRALASMADSDCRPPREQMRFLLREEARRRGLLPLEDGKQTANEGVGGEYANPH